jgi:GT2 family glycosyltransferase
MTGGGAPRISVIIPSVNGLPMITDTLAALEAQSARADTEILVLDCTTELVRKTIRERHPAARLFTFDHRLSIPRLREHGLEHARGDIVVMLEDHCIAPPQWLDRLAELHGRLPHAAIAGAVENGSTERAIDWAHYLCEYSATSLPLPRGEAADIAGNSTGYKRAALESVGASAGPPRWESFLHERLRQRGYRFYCDPDLYVIHRISFSLGDLLGQRFHYSRSFAAMRREDGSAAARLVWLVGSLLLPPVILARITRQTLRKRRYGRELARAWPFLCLLSLAWGFGEFVGYIAGPGRSLEKVR